MAGEEKGESTPILAFTGKQIERLTGLSQRQLRYWEESGVYAATYVDDLPRRPYRRIYSFRDLVSLRTLALLRNTHKVPLADLRDVGAYLSKYADSPWSELQFRVMSNHAIVFRDPKTGEWVSNRPPDQLVMDIFVEDIRNQAAAQTAALRERSTEQIGTIQRHRHVAHNRWVIAGTRVPTSAIWNFHEAGYSREEIRKQYPHITLADVDAAIAHETKLRRAA